jgi:hypothetical protein
MSDTQARLDAITVALDRLLEQDSWEQPYVNAGREALTALAAELERVTAVNETLRNELDFAKSFLFLEGKLGDYREAIARAALAAARGGDAA